MRVIGGVAKGHVLLAPKGLFTRPTTDRLKESLFSMLAPYLCGVDFLDLFSGSGAVGIEALSRGALSSVFVDNSHRACHIIRKNLCKTKFTDKSLIINVDVFNAIHLLQKLNRRFHIVFLDPPYSFLRVNDVLLCVKNSHLLSSDAFFVVEHSSDITIQAPVGFCLFKKKVYKTTSFSFLRCVEEGDN